MEPLYIFLLFDVFCCVAIFCLCLLHDRCRGRVVHIDGRIYWAVLFIIVGSIYYYNRRTNTRCS